MNIEATIKKCYHTLNSSETERYIEDKTFQYALSNIPHETINAEYEKCALFLFVLRLSNVHSLTEQNHIQLPLLVL